MIAGGGNRLLPLSISGGGREMIASIAPSSKFSACFSIPSGLSFTDPSLPVRRATIFNAKSHRGTVLRAKFDTFEADGASQISEGSSVAQSVEEEDSDLPSDMEDAIRQSGRAAALFASSGGMRAIVELLIPQLQFLDSEGAQEELWALSRVFLDTIIQETGGNQRVKAIFPDTGAAALLRYSWKDAEFGFASLSDRKPVEDGDDIVVMILPDYQMLDYVEKIASRLSDDPPRPLIMWNPRLISEDVGVGFNVRKLRKFFLSTFTTVYSMRPMPEGAVFRCYPGKWKVFYDDKDRPNRYRLAKEQAMAPDASDLETIFGELGEKGEEENKKPSIFGPALGVLSSLSRFMRVISK
ncbi:DUF1995 domain protein, putative (DUF1995) [Wolffia australiana]